MEKVNLTFGEGAFGLPKKREEKEKSLLNNIPVIRIEQDRGAKTAKRMFFNDEAAKLLEFGATDNPMLGFAAAAFANGFVALANIGKHGFEGVAVTKSNSVSSKPYYEKIVEVLSLDTTEDQFLHVKRYDDNFFTVEVIGNAIKAEEYEAKLQAEVEGDTWVEAEQTEDNEEESASVSFSETILNN